MRNGYIPHKSPIAQGEQAINVADASATVFSPIAKAKGNELDVFAYLWELLANMADWDHTDEYLEDLMPWSEFSRNQCCRSGFRLIISIWGYVYQMSDYCALTIDNLNGVIFKSLKNLEVDMDNITKLAQSSSLPITQKSRTWGPLDMYFIASGFAIATWSFLSGGFCASVVSFKVAVACTVGGSSVGFLMLAIAMGFISSKYGIDGFNGMIPSLGRNFMMILLVAFAAVGIGWVAVLGTMVAGAVQNVTFELTGQKLPHLVYSTIGILAIFSAWMVIRRGTNDLKWVNRVIVPCILFCCGMMAVVIIKDYGWQNLLNAKPVNPYPEAGFNVTLIFEIMIGGGISWFTGWGGLVRVTKTERVSFWPNLLAIGITAPITAGIATAAGYAVGNADPTKWMIPLGGVGLGIVALIFVCAANIGSAATQMYVTAIGFKQFGLLKNKSWTFTSLCIAIPTMIMCLFNESVYTHFSILLVLSSLMYSPICAIMIVDYFGFRKKEINLRALYDTSLASAYRYIGGINFGGVLAFVIGVLVYCVLLKVKPI